MRYFLDRDKDGDWVIYLASGQGCPNGTVVLELPGSVPRAEAEKTRTALSRARELGRREVADEVSALAQRLRLAP